MLCQQRALAPTSGRGRSLKTVPLRDRAQRANRAIAARSAAAQPAAATQAYPPLAPLDDDYEATHAFSDFANWLVPGSLAVGRYPYVEPSRCKSYEEGEAKLEALLKAGITSFVSLQAEVPAQEQLRLAGVNGFMPYKSAAELIKHSMVGPPPADLMNGLRTPELDRFLPPRHKPANEAYMTYAAREQLEFARFPIEDLSVPTATQLEEIVADLQRRVADGEVPYVHCWGGRGRAGLVGAAFLAATYHLSAEEALERVQRAFDTRKDNERRSPETDQQHRMVHEFVAAHQERHGRIHKV